MGALISQAVADQLRQFPGSQDPRPSPPALLQQVLNPAGPSRPMWMAPVMENQQLMTTGMDPNLSPEYRQAIQQAMTRDALKTVMAFGGADITKPTGPLPELAEQQAQYHGSRRPITEWGDPTEFSDPGGLYHQAYYTTSNYDPVALGYGGGGPYIYRSYEIRPGKLVQDMDKVSGDVWDRLTDLPGRHGEAWRELRRNYPNENVGSYLMGTKIRDYFQMRDIPVAKDQLIQELKREGYVGMEHEGGQITGGVSHRVKLYWDPQRDLRIRPAYPNYPERIPPPVPKNITTEAAADLLRRDVEQGRIDPTEAHRREWEIIQRRGREVEQRIRQRSLTKK